MNNSITARLDAHRAELMGELREIKHDLKDTKKTVGELSVSMARLETHVETKFENYDEAVKSLRTWDKMTGLVAAVMAPFAAALTLWLNKLFRGGD